MRILLLIPPVPGSITGPWFLREERHSAADNTPTPPYMAPSILGYLRGRFPDYQYRVFDLMTEKWDVKRIHSEVEKYEPDLIISIVSANHLGDSTERLCVEFSYPTITVITPTGDYILEGLRRHELKGDYYVASDEVETVVADAVGEFASAGRIVRTGGLIMRQGGEYKSTGPAEFSDLKTYPMPAFDLFPFRHYNRLQGEVTKNRPEYRDTAIINGMKGCPFHCTFCIAGSDDKRARIKTGSQLFREVEFLYRNFGRRRFNFLDSEFSVNRDRVKEFCRLVVESGLIISFDIKDRIEFWDDELIRLMKLAGCRVISYGIETADPDLQKKIRKNLNLEKARKAIAAVKKAGISVHVFMMVGLPGETKASLRKTAEFIAETRPDGISWSILFPEVGSPFYAELKEKKRLLRDDWSGFRKMDELTFVHDSYRNMDEIKRVLVWVRNRYRKIILHDRSLPGKQRVTYLLRYIIGLVNYYTFGLTNRNRVAYQLKHRVGITIENWLFRWGQKRPI